MDEEQVAEPVEPVTLEELRAMVAHLGHMVGIMLLVVSQYPMPRELLVQKVRECGIEFDETLAFRPKSIVSPTILMPPGSH